MGRRRERGVNARRAIRDTLARLGMQASDRGVVAALADSGSEVAGGPVRQVRIQLRQQAARAERQRGRGPGRSKRLERP